MLKKNQTYPHRKGDRTPRIIGICSTAAIHLILVVGALNLYMKEEPPVQEKLEVVLDFTEPKPKVAKPIQVKTGKEPRAQKASPKKEVKLVQKSEAPVKGIAENISKESVVDQHGDVEQPAPKPEKKIIKKALFSSANHRKDSTAAHVAEKVSHRLKAGHSEGNTLNGDPDGSPSAKLEGRTIMGNLPIPDYDIQEEGKVVVVILVDQYGDVQNATPGAPGTTVQSAVLWEAARKAALKAKFNISSDSPTLQKGTITYYFKLK